MAPVEAPATSDYSSFLSQTAAGEGQSASPTPAQDTSGDYSSFLSQTAVSPTAGAPPVTPKASHQPSEIPGFSDRTTEQLANDSDFDPVAFYKDNYQEGSGASADPQVLDKLAEVARFRQIHGVGGKGAWAFFKGFAKGAVSAPVDFVKGVGLGAYHVAAAAGNKIAATADRAMGDEEAAAARDSDVLSHQVTGAAALEKGSFSAMNTLRKAGNAVFDHPTSKQDWKENIQRESSYQEGDEAISRGQGEATAKLVAFDPAQKAFTADELKDYGVHVDQADVDAISGVTNPLNVIPLIKGAQGAKFATRVAENGALELGRMATVVENGAARQIFKPVASIGRVGAVAEKGAELAGKSLKAAGRGVEAVQGFGAKAVGAISTKSPSVVGGALGAAAYANPIVAGKIAGGGAAIKYGAKAAVDVGEKLLGEKPWGGFASTVGSVAKTAAKGAATGVAGDTLALANTGVNVLAADNAEQAGAALGGAAGMGAAGALTQGAVTKSADLANLSKTSLAPENVSVPEDYAAPAPHDIGISDPQSQTDAWNAALSGTPEQRRMAYLAAELGPKVSTPENPVFVVPVRGADMSAEIAKLGGKASDASGVFTSEYPVGDKTAKVILLNVDSATNPTGHEFGEFIQSVLPQKTLDTVNTAADKVFNGPERDYYGQTYFEATGQGKYDPSNPADVAAARREYISEISGMVLNGTPPEQAGVPAGFARRLRYAYGSFLQNVAGVSDAAGYTKGELPVRVDSGVAKLVDNVLSSQFSENAKTRKEFSDTATTGKATPEVLTPVQEAAKAGMSADFSDRLNKAPGVNAAERDFSNFSTAPTAAEKASAQSALRQSLIDAAVKNAASGDKHLDVITKEIDAALPTLSEKVDVGDLIEHAAGFADKQAASSARDEQSKRTTDIRVANSLRQATDALKTTRQARDARTGGTAAEAAASHDAAVGHLTDAVQHRLSGEGIELHEDGLALVRKAAGDALTTARGKGAANSSVVEAFNALLPAARAPENAAVVGQTDSPRAAEVLDASAATISPAEPSSEISKAPISAKPASVPASAAPIVAKTPTNVGLEHLDKLIAQNPQNTKALRAARAAIASGGDKTLLVKYHSADVTDNRGDVRDTSRAGRDTEQSKRAAAEKENGPGAGGGEQTKNITLERVQNTNGKVQFIGKSPDKVVGNFKKLTEVLVPALQDAAATGSPAQKKAASQALSEINSVGFVTDGGNSLMESMTQYGENHAAGRTGTGRAIVKPEGTAKYPSIPDTTGETKHSLSQTESDLLNLLQGEAPQKTAAGFDRNQESVALARANISSKAGEGRISPSTPLSTKGSGISETNPLRKLIAVATEGKLGDVTNPDGSTKLDGRTKKPIPVDLRNLFETVSEVINADRVISVGDTALPNYTPRGDAIAAGFMPKASSEAKTGLKNAQIGRKSNDTGLGRIPTYQLKRETANAE